MKDECLFCKIIKGEINSYKIYEDDYAYAFLDIEPNNTGHTLVIPKKHIKDLTEMDDETFGHLNNAIKNVYNILKDKLDFDGLKIGQNNGILQEVMHYHIHMIPAYKDTKPKLSVEEVFKLITK